MNKDKRINPFKRRPSFKQIRESFLILCEGQNTEPIYFNAFRLTTATVRALSVTSGDAGVVVRAAIKRRQAETDKGKLYDQYWVVFDKDHTTNHTFNEAINVAEQTGFRVAYSNQAFELWFLLHFEYIAGPLHRRHYPDRLTATLGFAYDKDAATTIKVIKVLLNRQPIAIEHAHRLLKHHDDTDYRNPAMEESSTTVHFLVEELRRFL